MRNLYGNLIDFIENEGFKVIVLTSFTTQEIDGPTSHASWAEVTWEVDVEESLQKLNTLYFNWLIIDHYAFDYRWEEAMSGVAKSIMVIDDLADRNHKCNILLDQNLGRKEKDYINFILPNTKLLIGSNYALLRTEFYNLRKQYRSVCKKKLSYSLFVCMGGTDKDNFTGKLLDRLIKVKILELKKIIIVMGENSIWLDEIRSKIANFKNDIEIFVGSKQISKIMMKTDMAIGAAGMIAWERCCLGLPSVILPIAENQKQGAIALNKAGAGKLAMNVNDAVDIVKDWCGTEVGFKEMLEISRISKNTVSGIGADLVYKEMISIDS